MVQVHRLGSLTKFLRGCLSIQDRIECGFRKIHNDKEALKAELNDNIKSVQEELGETTKSLNAVRSLKEENKQLKKQLDSTTKKHDALEKKVETKRSRLVKQEKYSRRENLRMFSEAEASLDRARSASRCQISCGSSYRKASCGHTNTINIQ